MSFESNMSPELKAALAAQADKDAKAAKAAKAAQADKDAKADGESRRRLVKTPTTVDSSVVVVPTLNALMNDALSIVGAELAQYRSKTKRGVSLDLKEARVVTGYLDALTRASKESREQSRSENLSELSNEELLQLAKQLLEGGRSEKLD